MTYLEYIEFSGNQCLDVDFKPSYNTRVIMDVELHGISNNLLAFYGARDTNSATAAKQFVAWMDGAGTRIRSDYFGTSVTANVNLDYQRFIVDQNRNLCTANGVTATNTVVTTGTCSYNLFIGAVNNVGAHAYGIHGKVYSCKVYDDNVLVRDLIPARDIYGVAGMWDKVEKRFFWNVGGGEIEAGPVKSIGMISHTFTGLINERTYYARVFTLNPKGRVNNRVDLPWASAIPMDFPHEPDSYSLIGKYTTEQTWTAPEDGYFMIEVHGASGNGGLPADYDYEDDGASYTHVACGGSGAGGGYACSIVKLRKGDTIVTSSFAVGSVATVYINSSVDVYSNILVSSGGNGGNASANSSSGRGGAAGVAGDVSGGNISNIKGSNGVKGPYANGVYSERNIACPAGGKAAHADGNNGGRGGGVHRSVGVTDVWNGSEWQPYKRTFGAAAFIKISRGNTNKTA